jgi:AbrB family looped-hinge helix DNA binding protein
MWERAILSHVNRLSGNVRLDDRGRLVLPADFRSRLGVKPGDEVRISETSDGSLRIESRRTAARALIGLAGSLDHSVLIDLAADRQEQNAAEDADAARSGQTPPPSVSTPAGTVTSR